MILDYEILHKTGRKVPKSLDGKMENQEILSDLKLMDDINHSLNIYTIEELETADDINEGIDVMSSQNYRHLHVELNNKLGNNYVEQFPNYNEHLTTLINYIKSAYRKLRTARQDVKKKEVETGREEEVEERKEELKVEEELLNLKVKQWGNLNNINLMRGIHEIEDYIIKIEVFIGDYLNLYGKFKMLRKFV